MRDNTVDPCEVSLYDSAEVDIDAIEELLANDPENEYLLDLAAFYYYSSSDLARALQAYQTLVEIDFHNPSYHFYLASTLYRLELVEDAHREWQVALSLDKGGKYGVKAAERLKLICTKSTA